MSLAVVTGPAAVVAVDSPTKFSILVFLDRVRLVGDKKVPKVFGNGIWLVNDIRTLQ